MTDEQLEQIAERLRNTSPGEWYSEHMLGGAKYSHTISGQDWGENGALVAGDAVFIGSSKNDIANLLSHIDKLKAELIGERMAFLHGYNKAASEISSLSLNLMDENRCKLNKLKDNKPANLRKKIVGMLARHGFSVSPENIIMVHQYCQSGIDHTQWGAMKCTLDGEEVEISSPDTLRDCVHYGISISLKGDGDYEVSALIAEPGDEQ